MDKTNDLILIGDRVLVEPDAGEERTEAGLVLPASVKERDKVQGGRVLRTGPGYLLPNPDFSDEPWKPPASAVRYLPLQARPGDFAFFLRKEAVELTYAGKTYLIVPHAAILALVRPEPPDIDLGDLLE